MKQAPQILFAEGIAQQLALTPKVDVVIVPNQHVAPMMAQAIDPWDLAATADFSIPAYTNAYNEISAPARAGRLAPKRVVRPEDRAAARVKGKAAKIARRKNRRR